MNAKQRKNDAAKLGSELVGALESLAAIADVGTRRSLEFNAAKDLAALVSKTVADARVLSDKAVESRAKAVGANQAAIDAALAHRTEAKLPAGARSAVIGTVEDARTGLGKPNIKVTAVTADGATVAETTTDGAGGFGFELEDVAAGELRIEAVDESGTAEAVSAIRLSDAGPTAHFVTIAVDFKRKPGDAEPPKKPADPDVVIDATQFEKIAAGRLEMRKSIRRRTGDTKPKSKR